ITVILLLYFFVIGTFDIEKAHLFTKMAEGEKADNISFFEISGSLSNTSYRIFINCYFKKFICLSVLFLLVEIAVRFLFGFIKTGPLDILKNTSYIPDPTKSLYLACTLFAVISVLILCLFVYILIKYIFVEYIIAEKCSKYIEKSNDMGIIDNAAYKKHVYKNFRSFILGDRSLSSTEIYSENNALVRNNFSIITKFVLSFSGWFLLSLATLGIGFAFLIPYFNAASALLYSELKESRDNACKFLTDTANK
ncbi:MAG: hypothetical protein LUD81_09135, partial [Clostridiales bacterium]|nr:hypothetical protein [Clostridiales bacterium]